MSDAHDLLRENFERWEIRGRGTLTFADPVLPFPPFVPFPGHRINHSGGADDGRRSSGLTRFLDRCKRLVRGEDEAATPEGDDEDENEPVEPQWLDEVPELVELQMRVPLDKSFSREAMAAFLASLSDLSHPVAFEIVATGTASWVQWVVAAEDEAQARSQLAAHFPEIKVSRTEAALAGAWVQENEGGSAVMEFALAEYFMWPLASPKSDPFITLLGSMEGFCDGEAGVYQVIFMPVAAPWADEALAAVSRRDGKPFFGDGASLQKAAAEKMRQPLYGAVVRLAAHAKDPSRAWDMMRAMAPALVHFSKPGGNELRALPNEDYDEDDHLADLLNRRSRRCGMLLGEDELTALVHMPTPAVRSGRLLRSSPGTRPAPALHRRPHGVCLGHNTHDGETAEVWLSLEERVRHMHVLGASGAGKSTLLLSMIRQDMANGEGFGVLDPHGDVIDSILQNVPEDRLDDVVLIDPSDEEYSVGFNILTAHSEAEKTLLASDLISVFQRLSTSWGDQMGSVFGNAIRTFLESCEGGTLADLRRFLLDKGFRQQFLKTVDDPDLVFYWEHAFPQLGGNKSIGPILTRLEGFLAPKPIRYMVAQKANRLDFAELTDSGKIVLARLSQGQIGRENAYLLGSLLVAKFQQAAMARQRMDSKDRKFFSLYIDEFQNFITPSMAEILSGARKYRLGLVLAHQDLNQLRREPDVASAVLSNACVRLAFRVSEADAKSLESGFSHFSATDLQNLEVGHAIGRIGRSDADFNLEVPLLPERDRDTATGIRHRATALSRERYATARAEIEAALREHPATSAVVPQARFKEPQQAPSSLPLQEAVSAPPAPMALEPEAKAESPSQAVAPLKYETTSLKEDLEELGRGGDIHRAAQAEFKRQAEERGFRATIERLLPGSQDTVDLYLERDGVSIACEISVTNTLEYEMRNVTKCLRAGVAQVLVLAVDAEKHQRLRASVASVLSPDQQEKVLCLMKDEFAAFLESLPKLPAAPAHEKPSEAESKMVKGWKVRTNAVIAQNEEISAIEKELAATVAENLRSRKTRRRKKK